MSIQAAISHRTTYRYDKPISMGPQVIRLRPAPHCRTKIVNYSLTIAPSEHFINWQQDPFGNYLARIVIPERTTQFDVRIDLVVDMLPINPFDFFLEDAAHDTPFEYSDETRRELAPYLETVSGGDKFKALVAAERLEWEKDEAQRTIDFLVGINQRLQQAVAYTVRMEPGVQTPEETLEKALGSCRDSTWLLVAVFRELGIAARFVSGYLIQLKADEKSIDGPSGPEADFTDLHAWAEVYLPGAGWVGLDPTSGLFAAEGHIPLAATPAPSSAAAISGGHEACEVEFDFDMSVARVAESPRISLPHSDAQWRAIDRAGQRIDALLDANDVRLTMGGEPTFVAGGDRDAGEWNIDAVGPTKRAYADQLVRKLRERFAPDGVLQHGQGKWYPGEPLPRWAFGLYWRSDETAMWQDRALIAEESGQRDATVDSAQQFAEALCDNLGVDADFAMPAFEDPATYLVAEADLPVNVTTQHSKLEDAEERARLASVFSRGLGKPAAYVLPIQAAQSLAGQQKRRAYRWISERWKTRRGQIFLKAGDSPAGFRLPLGSLSWVPELERNDVHALDPFAARGPLPARTPKLQSRRAPNETLAPVAPGDTFTGSSATIRTALSIEPRDGILCVFLPPMRSPDEFVDMVAALEETAVDTGTAIHIEGYPPPSDARMNVIKVTPDPGVIEVNVHPGASWREQVDITTAVYAAARECGLEASKFMIDGRPTGSGGGSHIVVGGATPEDSPFLRRPDVLASLLRYWQNHPSLSYFFAGMFIGPTSQAPRIDEARHDSLYELDIALSNIPDPMTATPTSCPPWLVDRLFRHLLVDVTGNTHRAEICIDKLFSPDSSTGRLGLVEFRGFEMPPHERMNLSQQLLLRGLIAWFWKKPYLGKLQRFRTALHDRFMLPYFLRKDLNGILAELSAGTGVSFDPSWFDAQYEFRFPLLGIIEGAGATVELRSALEPWHVLGEEGTAGGTARFVDSSLERIQIHVTDLDTKRYAIACNCVRVPLTRAGNANDHVAGVRFKSWQPASSLHPTIEPHGPLVIDIYDLKTQRVVAGATYYTTHPGGFNFELQPVNALEADGRRQARFSAVRNIANDYVLQEVAVNPEFPTTLDLRFSAAT
ncbi:MAG: transglutaminase family protein [Pseudomonadota bacterium]